MVTVMIVQEGGQDRVADAPGCLLGYTFRVRLPAESNRPAGSGFLHRTIIPRMTNIFDTGGVAGWERIKITG